MVISMDKCYDEELRLKKKPVLKISAKQLCRDYFDSQIFMTKGDFELLAYGEIAIVDSSAMAIDTKVFIKELSALNIELFGLAWFVHNYEFYLSKEQRHGEADSALCAEITFTKSYLEQTGNSDIWSAAGFYNDILLQSTIAQRVSLDWSIPRNIPLHYTGEEKHPFETESEKLIFESLREHYDKLLTDKECASRLGNRLVSVEAWRDGIMIPQKLSSAFAQRLTFSPNIEALLLLQRLTIGLYNNSKDYIEAVIDYGSWKLARKASDDFRQHLTRLAQTEIEKQKRSDKPELP